MRIVVASMIRNEADRFLASALECWKDFADQIVVLNDASVDATAEIAQEAGAHVITAPDWGEVWGGESEYRQFLFDYAYVAAGAGNWILWLDADMIPARSPRPLLERTDADTVLFRLFDLWGEDEHGRPLYRDDAFWRGHHAPRPWAIRVPDEPPPEGWIWNERGIHCGHLPLNWTSARMLFAPLDYSLLHYAYHHEDHRIEKYDRYMSVQEQLSPLELAHAKTIRDSNPRLQPLPFVPEYELRRATVSR